jgi:DNA-binding response OmpR family regulator
MQGKGSVLVVDDEQNLATAYERTLTLCGYEALSTDSSVEAAAIIDETTFDVVIADVVMPVYSGLALLERALARDEHTSVILITGVADEASAGASVGRAFRWLRKPVSAERLCAVVALGVAQARFDRQRADRPLEPPAREDEDTARLTLHRDGRVALGDRFGRTLWRASGSWARQGVKAGAKKLVVVLLVALLGVVTGLLRHNRTFAKWFDRLGGEARK